MLVFVVLIGLFILAMFSRKIPENSISTVGNTAGNINNGGYFCEDGSKVFFANAYDNYSLYVMNPDETGMQKLGSNSVSYISQAGDYLYYYMQSGGNTSQKGLGYMGRTAGLYRSKKNGKSTKGLDQTPLTTMQLCGNYLVYQKYSTKAGSSLNYISIDKKESGILADEILNPACYVDGLIYYGGEEKDQNLHTFNPITKESSLILTENVYNPIVMGEYVYYMDISNNYCLCRYNRGTGDIEVLTDDRVDFFNVYGSVIFYQKNSPGEPALIRMNADGSGSELIMEGIFKNINITSQKVYFNEYDKPTPVYETSTFGGVGVSTFWAAEDAAVKNAE